MRMVKRYELYGFSAIKINIINYITNSSFSDTLKKNWSCFIIIMSFYVKFKVVGNNYFTENDLHSSGKESKPASFPVLQ